MPSPDTPMTDSAVNPRAHAPSTTTPPTSDGAALTSSPSPGQPSTLALPSSMPNPRRPSSGSPSLPSTSPSPSPSAPLPSPAPRVHVRMSHGPPPKSHSTRKSHRPATAPAADVLGQQQRGGAFLPAEPGSPSPPTSSSTTPAAFVASPSPVPSLWTRSHPPTPAQDDLGLPVHIPPHPPTPGAAAVYADLASSALGEQRDMLGSANSWPLIGRGAQADVLPAEVGKRAAEREGEREGGDEDGPTPTPSNPGVAGLGPPARSGAASSAVAGAGVTSPPRPPVQHQPSTDWRTFIQAYALGRWDPNRTPNQPVLLPPSIPVSWSTAPVSAPSVTLGRGVPPTGGVNPHLRRSVSSGVVQGTPPPPLGYGPSGVATLGQAFGKISVADSAGAPTTGNTPASGAEMGAEGESGSTGLGSGAATALSPHGSGSAVNSGSSGASVPESISTAPTSLTSAESLALGPPGPHSAALAGGVPLALALPGDSEKPLPPVPVPTAVQTHPPNLAQRRGTIAPDLSAPTPISAPPVSIFSPTRPGSEPSSATSVTAPLPQAHPQTQVLAGRMPFPSIPRTPGTPGTAGEGRTPLPSPSLEAAAATATIRWAGSRVDVAPLSLPSPEHELMDPLRGFTVSIPGTHDQPLSSAGSFRGSPIVPRVAPKGSFWEGTQDVYAEDGRKVMHHSPGGGGWPYTVGGAAASSALAALADAAGVGGMRVEGGGVLGGLGTPLDPIAGSPLSTPEGEEVPPSSSSTGVGASSPGVPRPARDSPSASVGPQGSYFRPVAGRRPGAPLAPASAPLPHARVVEAAGDYFTDPRQAHQHHQHQHSASRLRNAISPSASSDGSGSPAGTVSFADFSSSGAPSSAPTVTGTPPALARRTTDLDQLVLLSQAGEAQPMYAGGFSLSGIPGMDKRTKEEREFTALGFFVPPQPPDEEERRKALYRFNVMHTARDVNFDRIAHLAKLVFKTKMVYISLVDAAEQWFKAESGVGVMSVARDVSFCGHCILQRGDEPMIVLDATRDWRFQRNPLVTGPPHIRFYAGAPLRTHEGYNVGSLCVIDDEPWPEFTPRQRHTLKEFAAIVMRELELWRDKIQLRIRDRIQTSMEHFTRECLEMDTNEPDSMNRVYDRAAKLVKRTLDVEGALVLDISHLELMEITDDAGKPSILFHGDPYGPASAPPSSSSAIAPLAGQTGPNGVPHSATILHRKFEFGPIPPLPVLGSAEAGEQAPQRSRGLTAMEHAKLSDFLVNYPDGKIYEGLVPLCFRHMLPSNIQYAMIVPVWSIDKNCFVLLLAYTTDISKHYLEGYELQYLRAIGVIILSSMLKRRMQLADKAKSHFISNISHELRTPLHGILAAAELLGDTRLSGTQSSFLHTVQACATSLVETVNHVLDFTKLSGSKNVHAQPEQPIKHGYMDLITLVEETAENCFIGQQARAMGEIGSVYAPSALSDDETTPAALTKRKWARVETVVDVALRRTGWNVLIERGGIRRILTNLIGNSLKFTADGYVQVSLRESQEPAGPGMIRVELIVADTGKGISKDFLKNQLFHPFSQENPMQSGTGLGLAIVNSIVRSESVNGKLDVWSVEGQGTEIKVSFDAEVVPTEDSRCGDNPAEELDVLGSASVSLLGFDQEHRGQQLSCNVIKSYLSDWWDFDVKTDPDDLGNILIVNEDVTYIRELVRKRDVTRPVIMLSAIRGDQKVVAVCDAYERMGGLIAVVFKPGGPSRLLKALKLCLTELDVRRRGLVPRSTSENLIQTVESLPVEARDFASMLGPGSGLRIRPPGSASRPTFVRSRTDSGDFRLEGRPLPPPYRPDSSLSNEEKLLPSTPELREDEPTVDSPGSPQSMISVGNGGVMVKSAVAASSASRKARVLVIEDNPINRRVLGSYLSKRGHQYYEAVDGQDGVERFNARPPWFFDVLLVDMSMPRLDGVETTIEIRKSEAERRRALTDELGKASTIFALTGLAAAEDKRKAFNAGVDGYLVKPVSLKSLDEVFSNLGFS